DSLPILEQYRIGNANNSGQLDALFEEVIALQNTINDDNNVTADEVAAFEAQRDVVAARLKNLYVFVHPDVVDGNTILNLKEELANLTALTPVVGSLDVDNADVTTYLSTFSAKVENALTTTENTVTVVLDLEQKIQVNFASREAKILDLTKVEQAKRDKELEDLQVDLANFLRAISISFEVNNDFADLVASGLREQKPAPGSIMNLFT
ncbi:MAG TPA: hypothetical protein VGA19_11635, partial [Rhodospirillales bacterium]